MISDNAICFKNEEVKLSEEPRSLQINWKFIFQASPCWGGFWERLVQSNRQILRKSLFRVTVTYEELLTVMIEIEGILNCRPITYVYNDAFSEPLTPSDLIYAYRILSKKSVNDQNLLEQFSTSNLSKHMKYLHNLLEPYWNQWTKEYLNELREYNTTEKNVNSIIKLGDIAFVYNHNAKRNVWKLGKVIRLFTSKDQNVRAATV